MTIILKQLCLSESFAVKLKEMEFFICQIEFKVSFGVFCVKSGDILCVFRFKALVHSRPLTYQVFSVTRH